MSTDDERHPERSVWDWDFAHNDKISDAVSRNVDAESTGYADEVISNGTIEVSIQEGQVRLAPWLQFDRFSPTYRGDDPPEERRQPLDSGRSR